MEVNMDDKKEKAGNDMSQKYEGAYSTKAVNACLNFYA